jgi:hypothetical protein
VYGPALVGGLGDPATAAAARRAGPIHQCPSPTHERAPVHVAGVRPRAPYQVALTWATPGAARRPTVAPRRPGDGSAPGRHDPAQSARTGSPPQRDPRSARTGKGVWAGAADACLGIVIDEVRSDHRGSHSDQGRTLVRPKARGRVLARLPHSHRSFKLAKGPWQALVRKACQGCFVRWAERAPPSKERRSDRQTGAWRPVILRGAGAAPGGSGDRDQGQPRRRGRPSWERGCL